MDFAKVDSIKYKNVKISNINYQNVIGVVHKALENRQPGYICLTDVANLMVASKTEQLQTAINGSLLSLPDGMPLAWYGRLVGCKEIERISGASLLTRLLVDMGGFKHYLLGDTEETIDRIIAKARTVNREIKISGHSPVFKVFDDNDNRQMMEKIRKADPDIIWVSFGGGKQEKWMHQNIGALDRGVMIGVGAAFRFYLGDIVTPPKIFQSMGLQWVFRLAELFAKDPVNWLKHVKERDLLKSKVLFVVNLPSEVKSARQLLRSKSNEQGPVPYRK